MSVNRIDSGLAALPLTPQLRGGAAAHTERRTFFPSAPTLTPPLAEPGADSALPVEAPAGTDPALWSVLTTEERVFFARVRTLGPLTYRPGAHADAQPLPRGGRIDVRV